MKIAMVINTSWNIHNFRMGLVRHLQSQGHWVYFLAPEDEYTDMIRNEGAGFFPLKMQNTGANPFLDMLLGIQLYRYYKKLAPDVVLHYTIKPNIYGTMAARRMGIPVINNVSGLGTISTHKTFTSTIARWLYKMAFRGNVHVFFQNADDQRDFRSQIKIKVGSSVIPGSGIDVKKYAPLKLVRINPVPIFLMVGRILVDKGVNEYIQAAENILQLGYKAIFRLAGDIDPGHVRGISKAYIQKMHDQGTIQYLGHVAHIAEQMHEADWIVLPSYREGTARTLLEAAALGKPLIASDVPGCNHVVKHLVNGLLCQPRSAQSLTDALLHALSIPETVREDFGVKSREIAVSQFDEKLVFDAYSDQIERMVVGT